MCIRDRQWFNPFPKVRYTERPDCAAASIAEGRILLLVDNSAAAMILPTSIFDFVQDTNDFYFPPLVGSYLRFVRALVTLFKMCIRDRALQDLYRERARAMCRYIDEYLAPAGITYQPVTGGLFVWCTLPERISMPEFCTRAVKERKVAVVPGSAFLVDEGLPCSSCLLYTSGRPQPPAGGYFCRS